jgi:hypothetical protein
MATDGEPKPPPNRDQDLPKRQGEDFPGTEKPETGRTDRDRDTPPTDETFNASHYAIR